VGGSNRLLTLVTVFAAFYSFLGIIGVNKLNRCPGSVHISPRCLRIVATDHPPLTCSHVFFFLQDFSIKGIHKDGAVTSDMKASYETNRYKIITTLAQASGKLGVALTAKEFAPGVNLGVAGTLPDTDSGKISLDYVAPHITLKSASTLTAAPKVDVSATTRFDVKGRAVIGGGEVGYDAAKGAMTGWKLGFAYSALDYQVAATLNDKSDVTALIAHSVRSDVTVGAEVVRNLNSSETALAAGVSRRLPSGALQKVKVQHTGIVSVLHEQALEGKSKVTLSGQFDAKDLNKAPKYGVGFDFKY